MEGRNLSGAVPLAGQSDLPNQKELDSLFSQVPGSSESGARDRAILELFISCGIRVNELVNLDCCDFCRADAQLSCRSGSGRRILSLNPLAMETISVYLTHTRPRMLKSGKTEAMFLNYQGKRLSRQSVSKMVSRYALMAGINREISPQTLRRCFADQVEKSGADPESVNRILGRQGV